MGRLQSGLLLFETSQGVVQVEPAFKERLTLLWTFRNFRRLSPVLLNSRENLLVNSLYHSHPRAKSTLYDPAVVIGVVEDFVPMAEIAVPNPIPEKIVLEKPVAQNIPALQIVPEQLVALKMDVPPAPKKERQRKMAKARTKVPARTPENTPRLERSHPATPGLASFSLAISRRMMARLATAVGALSLCALSVVAWHRIEAVPNSQAQSRPQLEQVSATTLSGAPIVHTAAISSAPAAALVADPDAPIKRTSFPAAIPTATPAIAAPAEPTPVAAIPAAAAKTAVPEPKPRPRVHNVSTRVLPFSGEDSGIQATRPPLRYVYPDYSDLQARGVVTLQAELDAEGKVRVVKVVKGNRELAEAAVRAVRQWRYRPYLRDGRPVATETNILISFLSSDAVSMSFPPSLPATR